MVSGPVSVVQVFRALEKTGTADGSASDHWCGKGAAWAGKAARRCESLRGGVWLWGCARTVMSGTQPGHRGPSAGAGRDQFLSGRVEIASKDLGHTLRGEGSAHAACHWLASSF